MLNEHAIRVRVLLTVLLCFQSVVVDIPSDDEDPVETIEQLRNRYETCVMHNYLVCMTKMAFHIWKQFS